MTEEMLQATIRNQRAELASQEAQLTRYRAILALAKESNQVLVEALKFYGQEAVAAAALSKYEDIKRRAQDVTKPL